MKIKVNGADIVTGRVREIAELVAMGQRRRLEAMGVHGGYDAAGAWTGFDYQSQKWITVSAPGPVGGALDAGPL